MFASKNSIFCGTIIGAALFCGSANNAVLAQVQANGSSNATTSTANPLSTPTSINPYGQSSALRPIRYYYPHHYVQNPSNPWLPPNLSQVNTGINPVGSTSPQGALSNPASILTNPNTTQNPGFPTVPTYNINGGSPLTTQIFSTAATNGGANSLANPTNPGAQNVGATGGGGGGLTIPGPNFP